MPDSDVTPIDNELQNLIPNMLDSILALAWKHLANWFFGVDVGIYYQERGTCMGCTREWLYWYTEAGDRLPTPEELAEQTQAAQAQARAAEARAERLAAKLRELNIDPDAW